MKVLNNARIHTLDLKTPHASAMIIEGGRIQALGGENLGDSFPASQVQNMEGKVIIPGLIDAHLHLQELALFSTFIDCDVDTKEKCLERVRERLDRDPSSEWIRGHGWNQNDWGGKWPSATDIESVAPGKPVYLTAKSLHAAWVSQKAMQLAGINPSTPDPDNGHIQKDQSGLPTGILLEAAMKLVERVIPEPEPETLAGMFQTRIIPDLWRVGLTGVHDFDKRTCFQALQLLDGRNDLHLRVVKSIPLTLLTQASGLGLHTGFGSEYLRIGSVKLFADGALGPHTGALFEPYVDDPQNRGMLILKADNLFEYGRQASEIGLSMAVHAIGDRAVHEVLDGFALLRSYEHEVNRPTLRHRIEHVQTIQPADSKRLAELGVIASMQPSHAPSDMDATEKYLGARSAFCYSWRTLLDDGVRLAFGSDAPVESPNPFHGLHAAVSRRRSDGKPGPDGWHPEQRLTFLEALQAFTLGPAYAGGMENTQGRLAPGSFADLIVMERDPFECEPDELRTMNPTATMVGGDWVWQK